jgi:Na+-driven multidrug efflux pump
MKKAYDNYNDYNDVSLVDLQDKSNFQLTYEILFGSFNSILPFLLLTIIDFLNLYFLGKVAIAFTNFQICVIYLNLFGFVLAIGVLFNYEGFLLNARNVKLFYETYQSCKDNILFIFITLLIPISLISYPILSYFFDRDLDTLWIVYCDFLAYSSLILLFKLLMLLNVKVLQIHNNMRNVHLILITYFGMYVLLTWIFLFRLNNGILGLGMSLLISSIAGFLISHLFVLSVFNYFQFDFGKLLSFDFERMKNFMLIATYKGFFSYLEYAGYGLLVLTAYYLGDEIFITNLILFNILAIPHTLCEGFANSIRNYLLHIKTVRESYTSRKKYITCFTIVVLLVAILFSACIFYLKSYIPSLYGVTVYDASYDSIITLYCIFIFCDYLSIILDGYIKGKEFDSDQLSVYKGIILLVIFVPGGLFLTVKYDLGLLGIWMTIYTYMGSHFIVDLIYVYMTHGFYGFKE